MRKKKNDIGCVVTLPSSNISLVARVIDCTTKDTNTWHKLEIDAYQRTDTTLVNKITLNFINANDLELLSRCFLELSLKLKSHD